jgi:hypothetical protein
VAHVEVALVQVEVAMDAVVRVEVALVQAEVAMDEVGAVEAKADGADE